VTGSGGSYATVSQVSHSPVMCPPPSTTPAVRPTRTTWSGRGGELLGIGWAGLPHHVVAVGHAARVVPTMGLKETLEYAKTSSPTRSPLHSSISR
jgi:hypothetical protein